MSSDGLPAGPPRSAEGLSPAAAEGGRACRACLRGRPAVLVCRECRLCASCHGDPYCGKCGWCLPCMCKPGPSNTLLGLGICSCGRCLTSLTDAGCCNGISRMFERPGVEHECALARPPTPPATRCTVCGRGAAWAYGMKIRELCGRCGAVCSDCARVCPFCHWCCAGGSTRPACAAPGTRRDGVCASCSEWM